MSNYRRWRVPGASYFFTVVTFARRPLFDDSTARSLLRQAFVQTKSRFGFDIFAIVLLPDHLHCIWTLPPGDDAFPARWAFLKKEFTKSYLAAGGQEPASSPSRWKHRDRQVWQRRYWEHLIRDQNELYAYRDYIHLNPVKHGYVKEPTEWPWSSVHDHLRRGWLAPSWTSMTKFRIDVGEP